MKTVVIISLYWFWGREWNAFLSTLFCSEFTNYLSPAQRSWAHSSVWASWPLHPAPPLDGAGLAQVRRRWRTQSALQGDQGDQELHAPETTEKNTITVIIWLETLLTFFLFFSRRNRKWKKAFSDLVQKVGGKEQKIEKSLDGEERDGRILHLMCAQRRKSDRRERLCVRACV